MRLILVLLSGGLIIACVVGMLQALGIKVGMQAAGGAAAGRVAVGKPGASGGGGGGGKGCCST